MADPKKALVMVLGKPAKDDGDGGDYTEELKTALGDLAAALGVEVKDEDKGVEALRTICDCCYREMDEGG